MNRAFAGNSKSKRANRCNTFRWRKLATLELCQADGWKYQNINKHTNIHNHRHSRIFAHPRKYRRIGRRPERSFRSRWMFIMLSISHTEFNIAINGANIDYNDGGDDDDNVVSGCAAGISLNRIWKSGIFAIQVVTWWRERFVSIVFGKACWGLNPFTPTNNERPTKHARTISIHLTKRKHPNPPHCYCRYKHNSVFHYTRLTSFFVRICCTVRIDLSAAIRIRIRIYSFS